MAPPEAAHAASDVSEDDYATWTKPDQAGLHPDSRRFMELVEELKLLHLSKSMDYGETEEPLANIKNGANFVDIEPWRSCMVRIADKVQRLKTYCHNGRLVHESFKDNCLDLAAYLILAVVVRERP